MAADAVNIVGAGQCGSLLAMLLARRGVPVRLYERQADPRIVKGSAGRSINLALAARGINALQRAGVFAQVETLLVPMRGRRVHHEDGTTEMQPYGQQQDEQIHSVARGRLNELLLDAAEATGAVDIRFGHRAVDYDAARACIRLQCDGETELEIAAQPAIAADGAGSAVRLSGDGVRCFNGTQDLLGHGYKELSIPAGSDGKFQLEPDALHIWPRGEFMLIALPNPGGDFTLTLFLPNEGDVSFATLTDKATITAFFERYFADAAALMPDCVSQFQDNPLGVLGTVRCEHWHDEGKVLLLGDAAHAIVPFHGQGMNLAFEDCVVLEHCIDAHAGDWGKVFAAFEAGQMPNANAIADMALENYVEMRDTVRDPAFVLRKALAFELERRLPERFIPRYSMVMFHAEIPYAAAQERGATQQQLLVEFTRGARTLDDVDIDAAAVAVRDRLPPLSPSNLAVAAPAS